MARDYKYRIHPYRRRRRRTGRLWFLLIVTVGIAGFGGYYWFVHSEHSEGKPPAASPETVVGPETVPPKPDAHPPAPAKDQTSGSKPTDGAPAAVHQSPEPRFSFYKILPEKEVILPESEIKILKREEDLGQKPGSVYLLQVGSFANRQDAEKLQSRLAGIKLRPHLEMIKLEDMAWYRVKVGPYATLADADKVRQYLRSHKIDSVVQKATE